MNGKEVIAKLKEAGWKVARIEGSHHIMEKDCFSMRSRSDAWQQRPWCRPSFGNSKTKRGEAQMRFLYPYTTEVQEDGGYFVQFVDLEEAFTEGQTLEEAAFNASEVLSAVLSFRLEKGDTIPVPSSADGLSVAAPRASVQSAILLREARGERNLSDLARALETSWAAAQRLESPSHWPNLKQLDRAATILGKRLILSFE